MAFRSLRTGLLAVVFGLTVACGGSGADETDTSEGAVEGVANDDVVASGARFDISQIGGGQFVFNLKAKNGQTVLQSERYSSKQAAEKGVASVLRNIFDDGRIELRDNLSFAVKAKNGEEVARSEKYASASNRTRAIKSIRSLIAGSGEQDSDAPAPPSAGVSLPTEEVLVVPGDDGSRIRLVDAQGKLYLRMPGGKRLKTQEALEEWFFAFEGLSLLERDADGLPTANGLDYVQIEKGAAGYYFHFVDFSRDEEGLLERRILMTSPKTDYASESDAREAAKAAMGVLDRAPKG